MGSSILWLNGSATNKLISKIITHKKPSVDIGGFSPDRKF